jgi:hypothetical protein
MTSYLVTNQLQALAYLRPSNREALGPELTKPVLCGGTLSKSGRDPDGLTDRSGNHNTRYSPLSP